MKVQRRLSMHCGRWFQPWPRRGLLFSLLLGFLVLPFGSAAQYPSAVRISGRVTPPSIVTLTWRSKRTGQIYSTTTNYSGFYEIELPPGHYYVKSDSWSRTFPDQVEVEENHGGIVMMNFPHDFDLAGPIGSSAPHRISGRSFLPTGRIEDPNYGLNSYLLFASPPSPETRNRYEEAVEACLTQLSDIATIESNNIPKAQLNNLYILVIDSPTIPNPDKKWIIDNYDYSRSQVFLRYFSASLTTGPYLVSTVEPLSGISTLPTHYLFQDLSTLPSEDVSLWIQEFRKQAATEEFWKVDKRDIALLRMRDAIAVGALALVPSEAAMRHIKELLSQIVWDARK